uniref:PX domain-containing protein n=1 Tax=Rhabditophanes sp. KR3021 TaxID=114890 RepID=A0AC35TH91_9BILA
MLADQLVDTEEGDAPAFIPSTLEVKRELIEEMNRELTNERNIQQNGDDSHQDDESDVPKSMNEREDSFDTMQMTGSINISITDYEKRGDGINAYLVYRVATSVNGISCYDEKDYEVYRRFSDFLGLREKLHVKYQAKGIIIPAAPEKSLTAMAKTKVNGGGGSHSEDMLQIDVAETRMRVLERFLRRVVRHPRLVIDCDVRDFLCMDAPLIKANYTSALSGNSIMKAVKNVTEIFNKITITMDENDRWFESATAHVEECEDCFFKLQSSLEHLVGSRKNIAHSQEALGKQLVMLGEHEENTSLGEAIKKLGEAKKSLCMIENVQASHDSAILLELIQEHLSLIYVIKDTLSERIKTWQSLQKAQAHLTKKRNEKTNFELQGRGDKAAQMREELKEAENKVDDCERDFKDISKFIRQEYTRFTGQRMEDIKQAFIKYFESIIISQTKALQIWEGMVPETANIIA